MKKKNDHQKKIVYEKDSFPAYKNSKSIYILSDRIVKHVEGWKLQKSIDKNVCVRGFLGAKSKMYERLCETWITDSVIFYVGTNERNS